MSTHSTGPKMHPTIGVGDTGPEVEHVQKALGLPADGDFGPVTESGVRSFQGACGLQKDGIVGQHTWNCLHELDKRMLDGSDGLKEGTQAKIDKLVADSAVPNLYWEERGYAPLGYYQGLARTFALTVKRFQNRCDDAVIMAAAAGDPDDDALAYYREEFDEEGMDNSKAGLDTLRHLFVLMTGLGARESSGNYWEGRDMSADNVEADTCEAGLFQTSWNIHSCSDTIEELLAEFWNDPHGFRPAFSVENENPTANNLDCYGSGIGAQYQWLARFSPAFTTLVTGVGLRLRRSHWGPIGRHEVEIEPFVDDLYRDVQELVERDA